MKLNTERITPQSRFWAAVCALAKEAFPPEEYLAPAHLVRMAGEGDFDFLALHDGGRFVGFLAVRTHGAMTYLFFLAIAPEVRGQGYGSRALETFRTRYPEMRHVVDLERLDEQAPNRLQRARRRRFYLRNGFHETGLFLAYLGVEYEVLCMEDGFRPEEFRALMRTISVEGFDPQYFNL